MKTSLFLLLASGTFASGDFSMDFTIRDAYTSEAISGINIHLTAAQTDRTAVSNELGRVVFTDLTDRNFTAVITDPSGYYAEVEYPCYIGRIKTKTGFVEVRLYPSTSTLEKWVAGEDSLYGGWNDGTLAQELNTTNRIYGCTMDSLIEATFGDATSDNEPDKLHSFINENTYYPPQSIALNEQGRIYLKFIVETDGTLTHVIVENGVSPSLDAEAIRIVRTMPKWTPATCGGMKVRSVARLPIVYQLE